MPKKHHHYIPRFYLDGFLDPNKKNCLWVYDKEDTKVFPSTPLNIACEKHYHTFVNEEGEIDTETIENLYSLIEAGAAEVIRKIQNEEKLSEDDESNFLLFAASMMIRVPNFRQNIEKMVTASTMQIAKMLAANKKVFKANLDSYLQEAGASCDISAEGCRQFMLNGKYTIKINPQTSLYLSVTNIEHIVTSIPHIKTMRANNFIIFF